MKEVIAHYDMLIDENNDPFRDGPELRAYMDKWDGPRFVESMRLDGSQRVLEIGVGTGRVAAKVIDLCGEFTGIDISPKTISRARENLAGYEKPKLICADFLRHDFEDKFDVIYSVLTMMHFEDKRQLVEKAASILEKGGRFCVSLDKDMSEYIDMGTRKIRIYPDSPEVLVPIIEDCGMHTEEIFETEFANIIVAVKR